MTIAGFSALGRAPANFDLGRCLSAMEFSRSRSIIWQGESVVLGKSDSALLAEDRRFKDRVALFDGRLDNRRELIAAIDGSNLSLQNLPAPELVLFAYEKWGKDFADHIIGDFACAIWDGDRQRLILARDAIGVRPLFFWQGPEGIFFATEPRGLLGACLSSSWSIGLKSDSNCVHEQAFSPLED
jgi:asparagine synthase (glutamine-hydrolysing)